MADREQIQCYFGSARDTSIFMHNTKKIDLINLPIIISEGYKKFREEYDAIYHTNYKKKWTKESIMKQKEHKIVPEILESVNGKYIFLMYAIVIIFRITCFSPDISCIIRNQIGKLITQLSWFVKESVYF